MTSSLQDLGGSSRSEATLATAHRVTAPPSRWKTRVLLPGAIVLVVLVLLLSTAARTLLPATPVHVVPVVSKSVEGSVGAVTVQAPGWLEPDPHPYYVAALIDGVVDDILVLEGARVARDDVVARLIDDDARLALLRAEAELRQREAGRAGAEAELVAARLRLEHLIESSRAVALGTAAVAEARAEIERVRADRAVEQARLMEIQDEYDRKSQLIESQAVSEATVARLRLRRDAQQAVVEAVVAREAVLEAKLDQALADLEAATTSRELLIDEQRAVAMAEASVASAEATVALAAAARAEAALALERTEVRSAVDGVVMRRLASPGSKVMREGDEHSAHILHLYDPARLQVRVDVPLADAALVSVGQAAEVTVEVLPDRTFTGRVTRFVHEADIQKNTVEVKVAIDAPSLELKPDMLARVRFVATPTSSGEASMRERVFAPGALVRAADGGGATALVVTSLIDGRGRAERRSIVTGPRRLDGWTEIESGLQPGDLLIAEPIAGLEAGDRVRVVDTRTPGTGG
jgi:RND family efflux transporter MFP subunit